MPQKLQCPVCATNVTKSQYSIGCISCSFYYHIKCLGYVDEKSAAKTLEPFTCEMCIRKWKSNDKTASGCIDRGNDSSDGACSTPRASSESILSKQLRQVQQSIESKIGTLEKKVDSLIADFRTEVNGKLSEMQAEVTSCKEYTKQVDKSAAKKIAFLETKNNVLERRQNRADILVAGLPNDMSNIRANIIKIGQLVGVPIDNSHINHCCFINGRKCILVKFNCVHTRDTIMKNYLKTRSLKLSDVIGGDVHSRLYLNDNLPPESNKLQFLCRKLLSEKKIRKFNLINMDYPKAKIVKHDGSTVILDVQQCALLYDQNAAVQAQPRNLDVINC